MTTLLLLAAAATLSAPHPPAPTLPAAAVAHALRCAATNAVLAAMLDSAPDASPADRASAASFRAEAESWRARSGEQMQGAALARETEGLARQVMDSPAPDAAQALLESRLAECPAQADFAAS